jgi:hypothetical protein
LTELVRFTDVADRRYVKYRAIEAGILFMAFAKDTGVDEGQRFPFPALFLSPLTIELDYSKLLAKSKNAL